MLNMLHVILDEIFYILFHISNLSLFFSFHLFMPTPSVGFVCVFVRRITQKLLNGVF